jgi:hypothetical protein
LVLTPLEPVQALVLGHAPASELVRALAWAQQKVLGWAPKAVAPLQLRRLAAAPAT